MQRGIVMKRILCTILVLLIALCICGCDKPSDEEIKNKDNIDNSQSNTDSRNNDENDTVVVPNVVGMDIDEATKVLEEAGLKVEIETEHLVHKDNDPLSDFEPDRIVIKQDTKQGIIITKGSLIEVTFNSMTDGFKYKINPDQSITLTECYTWLPINETVTIPKEYDGYLVQSVDSSVTDIIWLLKDLYKVTTIKIPTGVDIIGDTNACITYY